MRQAILDDKTYYTSENIDDFLSIVQEYKNKNIEKKYYNIATSFDIETCNFILNNTKNAIMYCWSFCFDGFSYFGRTWEEFETLINSISDILELSKDQKLVVYVQYLSFEFGFLKNRFNWKQVFALDNMTYKHYKESEKYQCREILYCCSNSFVEFRCSYLLSNKSLEKMGDDLTKYHITKKVGFLDHSKIRHPKTKMNDDEILYSIDDTKVVVAYIWEELERYKNICDIPLTNTGRVREECRRRCLSDPDYVKMIKNSKLDLNCYLSCRRAFQGGFVHSNAKYTGKVLKNIASSDFTSSYPSVMLSERFPVGSPKKIDTEHMTKEDFLFYIGHYWCVFDIHFQNIKRKKNVPDDVISISRCFYSTNSTLNNGRVYSAENLSLTITGTDFEIYNKIYDWDCFCVSNLYVWKLDLLPSVLLECVLDFYAAKTELKGVHGKEAEYQLLKGMLNSIYGMMVTDIIRNPNFFKNEFWEFHYVSKQKEMIKYNTSKKRFTLYPWGIAIAAYARRNLINGILAVGDDYVYSDTDSIKYKNYKRHKKYFSDYNKNIIEKIKFNLLIRGINPERMCPKTIDGIKKPIGVWDFEGVSDRFKTLGCKRYLSEQNGELKMTVAGVSKKSGVEFLKTFEDPFSAFSDNLIFPKEYSGKKAHFYIDHAIDGVLTDYNGVCYNYEEKSCVYIESSDYCMGIGEDFKNFLNNYVGRFLLNG